MNSVERQIRTWRDRRPYRTVRQQNPEFTVHSIVAKVSRVPPLEQWSLIAGDAFHNLRAVLDHLVYAVGMHEANPASPPDPRRLAFPITDSPSDFKSKYWRIEVLRHDVRAEIEALQPYNRPHRIVPSLLGVLRDLDDTNKHRVLQMAIAQITQGQFKGVEYEIRPQESIKVYLETGEIVDGTEVASICVDRPTPNMSYQFQADLSITLPHAPGPEGTARSAVVPLFRDIATEVRVAIDRISSKVI